MTDLNRLKLKQIHPQLCTQLGIDLSASHNVISLPCVSELKCYQQLKTRLEGALKTKKKKIITNIHLQLLLVTYIALDIYHDSYTHLSTINLMNHYSSNNLNFHS